MCALEGRDGFAVAATTSSAHFRDDLARALAGRGRVYDVSENFGIDMEVFMKVNAPGGEVASVLAALTRDADVSSVTFVSRRDAYAFFQADFADQPALVKSTKPSDRPESFRIAVHSIALPQVRSRRHRRLRHPIAELA